MKRVWKRRWRTTSEAEEEKEEGEEGEQVRKQSRPQVEEDKEDWKRGGCDEEEERVESKCGWGGDGKSMRRRSRRRGKVEKRIRRSNKENKEKCIFGGSARGGGEEMGR